MSDAAVEPRADGRAPGYTVLIPARGVGLAFLWLALAIVTIVLIDRAGHVIELFFAGIVAAVIAAPAFRWLRRVMPSAVAILLVVVGGLGLTVGGAVVVARDLNGQAEHLADALHDAVGRLPANSGLANFA